MSQTSVLFSSIVIFHYFCFNKRYRSTVKSFIGHYVGRLPHRTSCARADAPDLGGPTVPILNRLPVYFRHRRLRIVSSKLRVCPRSSWRQSYHQELPTRIPAPSFVSLPCYASNLWPSNVRDLETFKALVLYETLPHRSVRRVGNTMSIRPRAGLLTCRPRCVVDNSSPIDKSDISPRATFSSIWNGSRRRGLSSQLKSRSTTHLINFLIT